MADSLLKDIHDCGTTPPAALKLTSAQRRGMAMDATKPDLVFGASGYIGTNLVEYLMAEGRDVRASSRNMEVLRGRSWDSSGKPRRPSIS